MLARARQLVIRFSLLSSPLLFLSTTSTSAPHTLTSPLPTAISPFPPVHISPHPHHYLWKKSQFLLAKPALSVSLASRVARCDGILERMRCEHHMTPLRCLPSHFTPTPPRASMRYSPLARGQTLSCLLYPFLAGGCVVSFCGVSPLRWFPLSC